MNDTSDNLKGMRILIVDDVPENIDVLRQMLSESGPMISVALNGEMALNLVKQNKPDLMLLDVMMPGISGFEVCQKIKAEESTKDIPIIFITAKSDPKDIMEGFSLGAVDYIAKPFNHKEVMARVNTHLRIQRYQFHLEELVEEQTRKIKATQEAMYHADKLSALGKLVGSIAHEFNNPISGMRNLLEQVEEEATLEEEHAKFINLSIQQCDRMAGLVRKLQGFYKPSETVKHPMNINQILDNVLTLMHKKIQDKGVTLQKQLSDDLPEINCVSDQIQQVLLNIIKNAEEAISDEAQNGRITATTETNGTHVKIHIQDSGSGISEEVAKTIFDPFFTTKSATTGTGLGLSVCYEIIKDHGGEILVSSKIGEGTTFSIILPV
jgi:C4-dicarboxylate-specific signal transduction histidine kinase